MSIGILAYINDLPDMISSSKFFAEDSMLFKVMQNENDRVGLQKDFTELEDWEGKWQMSFNASKCSVIQIVPRGCAAINVHALQALWSHFGFG